MVSGSVDNTAVMWDINKGLLRLIDIYVYSTNFLINLLIHLLTILVKYERVYLILVFVFIILVATVFVFRTEAVYLE